MDNAVLRRGLGRLHRTWMYHPFRVAACAALWYISVLALGGALDVLSSFTVDGQSVPGFWRSPNWGPLYLLLMPLAAAGTGYYLRFMENGLSDIDDLVKPISVGGRSFSEFLCARLRRAWPLWLLPAAAATPLVLTLFADGTDIIAPLQTPVRALAPSDAVDWATFGYRSNPGVGAQWFLLFNFLAWGMQVFCGYCGVLVFALTTYVLGLVFSHGLAGREITQMFQEPGREPLVEYFYPDWKYCRRRLGLERLDNVFLFFVGMTLIAFSASAISILVNLSRKGPTAGSVILLFGTVLYLPSILFWVFHPYFNSFPRKLPQGTEPSSTCEQPDPWPFGSRILSWAAVGLLGALWVALLGMAIKVALGVK